MDRHATKTRRATRSSPRTKNVRRSEWRGRRKRVKVAGRCQLHIFHHLAVAKDCLGGKSVGSGSFADG
jgi:hypothetical protein